MRTVSVEEAVATIPDGARVMIGGFMGVGACNGASKPKAFAAFTLITEVREFNGDVFNVGQN